MILPRKDENGDYYISYSQITKWKKTKRDYIRDYFFGEKSDNEGLQRYGDFGTKVGEALENNDFSKFSKEEQKFLKTVPRYDEFEREIRLEMGGYYIKGFIDTNKVSLTRIIDYKTGDILTKKKDYESEDYIQLDIYAAGLHQETGVLPYRADVILIGRSGNAFRGEELKLTRKFVTISKDISPKKITKTLSEIDKVVKEISEYYKVFLKMCEI